MTYTTDNARGELSKLMKLRTNSSYLSVTSKDSFDVTLAESAVQWLRLYLNHSTLGNTKVEYSYRLPPAGIGEFMVGKLLIEPI